MSMMLSLSARRAWIEIKSLHFASCSLRVALRKESVDRNMIYLLTASAFLVALRKESVDRNLFHKFFQTTTLSRSPQGERG